MLAELALANAAFATITEAIGHGQDLYSLGSQMANIVKAKFVLTEKTKKRDPKEAAEEFWALEDIKRQEKEFKELLVYLGRPGLWDDWEKFQQDEAARLASLRETEADKIKNRREVLYNVFVGIMAFLTGSVVLGIFGFIGYIYYKYYM